MRFISAKIAVNTKWMEYDGTYAVWNDSFNGICILLIWYLIYFVFWIFGCFLCVNNVHWIAYWWIVELLTKAMLWMKVTDVDVRMLLRHHPNYQCRKSGLLFSPHSMAPNKWKRYDRWMDDHRISSLKYRSFSSQLSCYGRLFHYKKL